MKMLGAVLVIAACGGFGFLFAANYRREEKALRQLAAALDYMECELQYRLTPLPELCRQAGAECRSPISGIFLELALQLENQLSPDVSLCMRAAISRSNGLPGLAKKCLYKLGGSLGRFDLEGQLKGLEAVRADCRRELESLETNRAERLRSYQTLGLCAGAALAILFI